MTSIELSLCVLLIILSAYLSASEIALFSLSRFQLRFLKDHFRDTHRRVKHLLSDPSGLLVTILVVNEVINISLSTLIAKVMSRQEFQILQNFKFIPKWAMETVLGVMITAPIVLLLCEITPKMVGVRMNYLISSLVARPIYLLFIIFKPIRFILTSLIRIASRNSNENSFFDPNEKLLKESDFMILLEEGLREGSINGNEVNLIRNVFDLNHITAEEISTPLSKVLSLPHTATLKGALTLIKNQRYSRIPILEADRKNVRGILYAKDLLKAKLDPDHPQMKVEDFMRKPFFVSPQIKLNSLFKKFKQNKMHMAILKNSNGHISGVVTMSDILDTLFENFFGSEDSKKK